MDRTKVAKAEELIEVLNRLESLHSIMGTGCNSISIGGAFSESKHIKAIVSSSKHTQVEEYENTLLKVMTNAGRKYLEETLKKKQEEFDKL